MRFCGSLFGHDHDGVEFYEPLSLVAGAEVQVNGPHLGFRVASPAIGVPAASVWSLTTMTLLMFGVGVALLRRRKLVH